MNDPHLTNRIRAELHGYPRPHVEAFIASIERSLKWYRFGEMTWRYEDEDRRALERLRRSTRHFVDLLLDPTDPRPFPQDLNALMDTTASDDEIGEDWFRAKRDAQDAAKVMLERINIALLRLNTARHGRPKADQRGLVTRIARDYLRELAEQPSSTPGGVFSNIITLLLTITRGKAPVDVSRPIRAALKAM